MSLAAIQDPAARRAVEAMQWGTPSNTLLVADAAARRAIESTQAYKAGTAPAPSLAAVADPALRAVLFSMIRKG